MLLCWIRQPQGYRCLSIRYMTPKRTERPGMMAPYVSPQSHDQSENLRILVVDDHLLVAETVVAALMQDHGFHVDTAPDLDAALKAVRGAGRYDVVLLDYDIPGMEPLEAMRLLIEANDGHVALFSGIVGRIMVERAIDAGAAGFIPKTLPLRTLGHAIRFIADGEVYLPAEYIRRAGAESDLGLKPREMQVLACLCEGLQNKEIGRQLGLNEVIVKMDVKAICRKLGARNRTQAVIAAQKQGLV